MKNTSLILGLFMLFSAPVLAQTGNTTSATFTVYGNCGMCKRTIEKAAKSVDGVQEATWDAEAQKVSVQFDESKAKVDAIKKAIAASGYDTDTFRAPDEAYNALHGCCQYERPEN